MLWDLVLGIWRLTGVCGSHMTMAFHSPPEKRSAAMLRMLHRALATWVGRRAHIYLCNAGYCSWIWSDSGVDVRNAVCSSRSNPTPAAQTLHALYCLPGRYRRRPHKHTLLSRWPPKQPDTKRRPGRQTGHLTQPTHNFFNVHFTIYLNA